MTLVYAVLGKVRTRYVNPERVHPQDMLREALDNIQRKIPEVIVWKRGKDVVEIQVDDTSRRFSIGSVTSPWDLTLRLKKIFAFIQRNLRPETDRKEVEYAAVDGLLSTLDPHSVLMRPSFFRQMEVDTAGSFGGLGIEISICDGELTIRRPMKHTPAWNTKISYGSRILRVAPQGEEARVVQGRRGWKLVSVPPSHPSVKRARRKKTVQLRAGDKIVRIENESTINMTLTQAVKRLRGRPNTDVIIWIRRKGWRKPRPFPIRRAKINIPSVSWRLLDKNLGYLRLKKFQATTTTELKQALKQMVSKMSGKGKLKGLVLDLRDNHGGLLDQAVRVVDAFAKSGTVVSTMGFAGRSRRELRAQRSSTVAGELPLAVLVNGESASAAEIVAAGLKQLNRAVVIGENTFGKGSVQVIFQTPNDTGLKLTVSQWFAPGNFSVQRVGLTPDVETVPVRIEAGDPIVYFTAQKKLRRERDLRQALKKGEGSTSLKTKPFATLHYLRQPIPAYAREFHCRFCGQSPDYEPPRNTDVFLEDFQVKLAKKLLANTKAHRRLALLAKARPVFKQIRAKQESKIVAKFKTLGVDWTKGSFQGKEKRSGARLQATVKVGKRGKVVAGEKLRIEAEVKNVGTEPAYRVRAETESSNSRLENLELFFGKIPAGQSVTASVSIRVPKGYPSQVDVLELRFFEQLGRVPEATSKMVRFRSLDKPKFAYSYKLQEGPGSDKDGLLEVGEEVRLRLTVQNGGAGRAQEAFAELRNLSGAALFVSKGRFRVSGLKPGQKQTVVFAFAIKKKPSDGIVRVQMKVRDCLMGRAVGEKLTLKVWPANTRAAGRSGVAVFEGAGRKEIPLRLCPAAECSAVARAKPSARLEVSGAFNGWLMTKLNGHTAFVKASRVKVSKKGLAKRIRVRPLWRVVQPDIKLSNPPRVVESDEVTLAGKATHPLGVADLFIRVTNKDAEEYGQKVFYKSRGSAAGGGSLSFKAPVPLWPGKNIVEIVARENERVVATRLLVILRKPIDGEKEASKGGSKR
jgi:carboxyl-terminal processing protease